VNIERLYLNGINNCYNMKNLRVPEVLDDSNYPDKVTLEEPEEENPTAYALLSEIKDPYYSRKELSDSPENLSMSKEEMNANIEVYKNFYAYPEKSEDLSKYTI